MSQEPYIKSEYEPMDTVRQRTKQRWYRRGICAGVGLTFAAAIIGMIVLHSTTKYVVCVGEWNMFYLKCLYKFF